MLIKLSTFEQLSRDGWMEKRTLMKQDLVFLKEHNFKDNNNDHLYLKSLLTENSFEFKYF